MNKIKSRGLLILCGVAISCFGCTKDKSNRKKPSSPSPSGGVTEQSTGQSGGDTDDKPVPTGKSPETAPSKPTSKTADSPKFAHPVSLPRAVEPGALGTNETHAKMTLVSGINRFALDLYGRLRKKGKNLFFSPLSISTALAMTYTGAHGKTADQMHKTLHFGLKRKKVHAAFYALMKETKPAHNKSTFQLNLANRIFIQKGRPLLADFKANLHKYYGCAAQSVDFGKQQAAAAKINGWVAQQTHQKIKEIVQPSMFDSLSRLVLANAIYFKGKWRYLFKKRNTLPRRFYLSPKKKVTVATMYQKAKFHYQSTGTHQILQMDYKGGDLSMVVLLPHKKDGLGSLEQTLSADKLTKWLKGLRKRTVRVFLPKFKLKWGESLKKDLKALGMQLPFSLPSADFRYINGLGPRSQEGLYIFDVLHKAFVEVNEEGTEAAAATAVLMRARGAGISHGPSIPVFRADHPFLFLIRNKKNNTILFMGRMTDPR